MLLKILNNFNFKNLDCKLYAIHYKSMKLSLLPFLFLIITQISFAQSQASIEYIDHGNTNEQNPNLYNHLNNYFIISSTETAQFSNLYLISISKTEKNGNILWTKFYNPGGINYSNFTTNKVQFKDSTILIYGICRDEINRVRKFFLVISTSGKELYSKIFPFTSSVTQFHASLSDSSTVECVYYDFEQSRLIRYEKFNRIGVLISTDSLVNTLKTSIFRAFNNIVYAIDLVENLNQNLELKLFQFDNTLNLIDSTILTTDITIFPTSFKTFGYANVGIILDSNVLFIEGQYDFNATDLDSYFIRLNLQTKQLSDHYYFKKNIALSYTTLPENLKYITFNDRVYSLQKLNIKNSTLKTIVQLSKINNGNLEWNRELYQSDDASDSIAIKPISLDTFENRILASTSFVSRNKLWQGVYIKNDIGQNYWNFTKPLDTASEPISISRTVYSGMQNCITLATTKQKNKFDDDLLWKKWNLDIFGGTNTTSAPKINIYPNPANEYITISGLEIPDGTIECTNVLGIRYYVPIENNMFFTYTLSPGVYFININKNNLKFIISNY